MQSPASPLFAVSRRATSVAGDSWASPLCPVLRRTTGFSIPRIRRRPAFLWIGHSRHPLSGIQQFACSDVGQDPTRGFPLKTAGMTEGEDGTARRRGGGQRGAGRPKGRGNTCKALFRSFPTSFIGNPGFCLFWRLPRSHPWIPAKNCGNDRRGRREDQKRDGKDRRGAGRPEGRGPDRRGPAGPKGGRAGQMTAWRQSWQSRERFWYRRYVVTPSRPSLFSIANGPKLTQA